MIELGGWPLLDSVLLAAVALAWGALTRLRSSALTVTAAALACVVIAAISLPTGIAIVGEARVGVVQGNLPWNVLRSVAVSPGDRALVRTTLLELTDRALGSGARLVVWPENGMGLPIGQVPSLLDALVSRAGGHSAQILATGDEIGPDRSRPTAWLVGSHVASVARKQEHVPLLEDAGDALGSLVVDSAEGKVGVLICYDAVRYQPTERAVLMGAEFLVSPTDNGSYVASTLTDWQLAASALLAVEHGRSLAVVANRGPSTFIDPAARKISTLVAAQTSGSAVLAVPRVRGRTWADRGGRLATTVMLIGFAVAFWRRAQDTAPTLSGVARPAHVLVCGTLVGSAWLVGALLGAVVSMRTAGFGAEILRVVPHHVAGSRATAVFDPGSRVFRQADEEGCGPAALAWILFGLGDTAYEAQLRRHRGRHSLADLDDAASERGFQAQPFVGTPESLVAVPGVGYVLHVDAAHFVGCRPRSDGRYAVFDPKEGTVVVIGRDELFEQWSGHGLEVELPPPP